MKKLLLLLSLVTVVLCTSCDDDDVKSIDGSTWKWVSVDAVTTIKQTAILKFAVTTVEVDVEWNAENTTPTLPEELGVYGDTSPKSNDGIHGTYTYDKPNVTLTIGGKSYTGVVAGNVMTYKVGEDFTKQ